MHAELLDDDDFADAPDDANLAFAFLEARARSRLRENTIPAENSNAVLDCYLEYCTAVISIAEHFDVVGVCQIPMPDPATFNFADYNRISQAITSRVYQIKAGNAERHRQTSVVLSEGERQRVRDKVSKLRELISKSELEDKRKAKLLAILSEFEQELIKPRTNFSRFLHIGVILAALHGSAGFVDDATKLYDGAVKILGVAKVHEEDKREPLQLPAPQKQLPAPASGPKEVFDLDDEIPF